ncbi:substrate-binding periplasmic protein [Inhella gelatinilytica]|uniref:Transporter substrate-binding domain-containing protein n=1 Tax=Inhella gelatinilytica TaxID=2795030 RepID=A0A931ND89_9BURK|nr:transporter substrate-binding domain-containing protein [Inhella gelatinilytica]MBH9552349.1 transporter substrate-binding domain-containing protein [Inhella gelatinilytica]
MKFLHHLCGGWLLITLWCGVASAQGVTLRLCAEDEDAHPWLVREGGGANGVMLRMVEQKLGVRFQVERMPWRRCLLSMKEGQVDGGFKASYSAERATFLAYPMKNGQVDEERRMLTESYHFYRRKSSLLVWDGARMNRQPESVGAQSGFSIVGRLRNQGFTVDDGNRLSEAVLVKLQKGRVELAALQTLAADRVLQRRPELAAELERMEPALVSQAYYLVFALPFAQKAPALVDRVWDTIGAVREALPYQQALNELMGN